MESFTEKMFDFQRRATQAVLQKMGAADTTVDEQFDNTLSNFKRLGEFLHHMEEQTQQSLTNMEKMCYTNNALASSLCNFVFSELSNDDNEFSTGLLSKFFLKTSAQTNKTPAENTNEFNQRQSTFQESVQRLYDSLGTMGHENFKTTQESLGFQVLNPIKKDEDVNRVTKQLLEKRKKLILEFDSLKRTNDFDKIRSAKEEFETMSKKTNAHLQNRSFIRCKLIVHTIVSMIQQFCLFFESNAILLEGLASFIEPLVGAYQLSPDQLSEIYSAKKPTSNVTSPIQNNSPIESRSPNFPSTPPPTYKDHIDQHNSNINSEKRNNSFENDFSKMSFTNGQRASPSPPTSTNSTQKEAKLFSVWDEEANNTGSDDSTNNSNSATKNNNNTSNTTPTKKQNADDDWMYNSSSTPNNSNNKSTANMNTSSDTWEDPLIPESTPKQQYFNTSTSSFNHNSGNFSRPPSQPQTPQHNNNHYPQQQQPQTPNNNNYPQQQQPQTPNNNNYPQQPQTPNNQYPQQQQQQQSQQKPKSGFENIFGDFDFTPPPQQRNTANFTTGGNNNNNPNFNNQPFNPTHVSPHVDHSQHQRSLIEPIVSEKIKNWGEKHGKKNNLRVLLSTLHEVLWEESGWEKVTYGAVMTPAQVKKVYRKAIMVVHPDKVHLGTPEQKMLAQRIFESLREGFDVFKVDLEPGN
ncbi:hypothetical protein CYY_009379 [Polysphondylium violaceum]|uniref:DNAJ heat shock N-terminal domain-containing protein n=1 Tax=Polysphondylium violaceum TaxID=133409 RepID=A0A8J4UW70_9MYCE|nr:hypothetical protein CYY_009379 [Polysphondylium violaceum]